MLMEPKVNPVSWDDIRVFIACAQAESFRKAARSLRLSSSTVLRRIERFEKALGAPIFERLPEGVILTGEGRALLQSARKMENASFDVLRRQTTTDVVKRGNVSISITEGLGAYWVMPRLVDFQRNYPFVIINLQCAMESADVLRLESDMAVQFSVPDNPDLIVVKLGRLHVHAFASRQYLDLFGVPKGPDDLKNHRIVQQVAPGLDERALAGFFGVESIDNVVAIRTNSSTAHFYAIEKGAGIGVLPTFAVALGAPVIPVDVGHRYHRDIWLTYHPDARRTPRRSLAIDWLKKIFDPKIHPWFRDEFIHPSELVPKMPAEAGFNYGAGYFSVTPR
jgi:DNA-binding transcriptional LysR family regulator